MFHSAIMTWCVFSTLTAKVTCYNLFFRSVEQVSHTTVPFTRDEFKRRILGWEVCEHQLFLTIENPKLRHLFDLFKPRPIVPSATTIKNAILKSHQEERVRIHDMLCSANCTCSITLDC
jgi:hypothetical protein